MALKDPVMSKLKNSTDLAIDKYNNLIVRDNGEKEKFSLWMEDFSIWLGKIIYYKKTHKLILKTYIQTGEANSSFRASNWHNC